MVTKKTRLMSALVAVLMLVSLFTAFTMPVSAEETETTITTELVGFEEGYTLDSDVPVQWPAKLVAGRAIADNTSATDIGIATADDWIKMVEYVNGGSGVVTKNLWFTEDIDFDADGDGKPTSIKTMGKKTAKSLKGTINGQGYKIENLLVEDTIDAKNDCVGLLGYSGSITVRDLSIASGTINAVANTTQEGMVGHFCAHTPYGTFINCWNNADINLSNGTGTCNATAITGFGRQNSGKTLLVNCINSGDLTKGATSGRVMAFGDWIKADTQAYNCINVGTLTGGAVRGLFAANNAANAKIIKLYNTYYIKGTGLGGTTFNNGTKVDSTTIVPGFEDPVSAEIAAGAETTGELAWMLNKNATKHSTYAAAYWTLDETGATAKTTFGTEANQTQKIAVELQYPDGAVAETYTKYYNRGETFEETVEGYALASATVGDASVDVSTGSFTVSGDTTVAYKMTDADYGIAEEIVADLGKYNDLALFAESEAMANALALAKTAVAYKEQDQTVVAADAIKAIAAAQTAYQAIVTRTIKADTKVPGAYAPNYYDITVTDWSVTNAADWRGLVTYSNEGENFKHTFKGETIHILDNINMNDEDVDPLGMVANFVGTIDGNGKVFQNLRIEMTAEEALARNSAAGVALIGRAGSGAIIRDLGIESGYLTVTRESEAMNSDEVQLSGFIGVGSGAKIYNCWNGATLAQYAKGSTSGIARMLTSGRMVNCYNIGKIQCLSGYHSSRASGLNDWIYGQAYGSNYASIYNSFNAGELYSFNGHNLTGAFAISGSYPTGDVKNVYAVGSRMTSSGTEADTWNVPAYMLSTDAYASGELAWNLNNNYDDTWDEEGAERTYYTVENGKTIFGTEKNQTIQIALVCGEDTKYIYRNADAGEIDLTGVYTGGEATYSVSGEALPENKLTATADTTVTVELVGTDYTALEAAIAAFAGKNSAYYTSETAKTSLDALLTANDTYTLDADGVAARLAELQSYTLTGMPKASEFMAHQEATDFIVDSLAEMEAWAYNRELYTADQTIHIMADIEVPTSTNVAETSIANRMNGFKGSIDGHGHILSNICNNINGSSWLVDYTGKLIQNITFYNCSATVSSSATGVIINTLTGETTLKNITLDSCAAEEPINNGNDSKSLLVGQISGNVTMENITIKKSSFAVSEKNDSHNKGLLAGQVTETGALNATNIYVVNNTITGKRAGSNNGYVIGDGMGTITMANVGVFGNTTEGTVHSALFGAQKNGTLTINNVIAAGNNGSNKAIYQTKTGGTTATNLWTDAEYAVYVNDAENVPNTVTAADITSGRAAYMLNQVEGITQTWIMADVTDEEGNVTGKIPAFGTEGLPVEVTFEVVAGEEVQATYYRYTDTVGKLIELDDALLDAAAWENEAGLADAVFTAETANKVTGYTLPTHEHTGDHEYLECVYLNDGTHKVVCNYVFDVIDSDLDLECPYESEAVACTPEYTYKEGDAEAHTATATCSVCGNEEEVACTGTIVEDAEQYVAPTCETAGKKVHVCDTCGYTYDEAITATGHAYGEWVEDENAQTHTKTCANAGCETPTVTEACQMSEWTETKAPSVDEAGEETRKCEVCSRTETQPIAALASIELETGSAKAGETVEVKVNLKNNPGVAGMTLIITFDATAMTLTGAAAGTLITEDSAFVGIEGEDTDGEAKVSFAKDVVVEGDGEIAVLTFKIGEEAADGNYEIGVEVAEATDNVGSVVPVEEATTTVTIGKTAIKGDFNSDEKINIADAILLLRYVNGESEALEALGFTITDAAADLNSDGKVMTDDVILLLQYLNEWITVL